jgi:hypothetical protein
MRDTRHSLTANGARALPSALVTLSLLAIACGGSGEGSVTPPPPPPPPPPTNAVTLAAGQTAPAANGQQLTLGGLASGGEYLLVVSDTLSAGSGTSNYVVAVTGTTAPGTVSAPSTDRIGTEATLDGAPASFAPVLDVSYGARLNERVRDRLRGGFSTARASFSAGGLRPTTASRSLSAAAIPAVGDLVNYNVNQSACDTLTVHPSRIVAVGTNAIIAVDTLNPPSGFSNADFVRVAANFDTLVYPLDVTNFGAPTDIDGNNHVVLLFTRAVNELTPAGSQSFVGGFFFSRDLFPTTAPANSPGFACKGSNVAEMFYLLAPDPNGDVNGNKHTTGFVDSLTTGIVAHEFQHLINAGRRIYVNNANDYEVVWLNEGLSHIAEELLFYRQAGLTPRQNISIATLRSSAASVNAYNTDQGSNAGRYRQLLLAPAKNSPVRNDDSLGTRGATWSFLRYATDRRAASGVSDATTFQALVNSRVNGIANLSAVYGAGIGAMIRDWSISNYTDDTLAGVAAELTQPSWNWHSIYPALGSGGGTYPLQVLPLATTGGSGTVVPGSAAYYRFAVPANASATVTVSGGTAAAGLVVGTVVRIR